MIPAETKSIQHFKKYLSPITHYRDDNERHTDIPSHKTMVEYREARLSVRDTAVVHTHSLYDLPAGDDRED